MERGKGEREVREGESVGRERRGSVREKGVARDRGMREREGDRGTKT